MKKWLLIAIVIMCMILIYLVSVILNECSDSKKKVINSEFGNEANKVKWRIVDILPSNEDKMWYGDAYLPIDHKNGKLFRFLVEVTNQSDYVIEAIKTVPKDKSILVTEAAFLYCDKPFLPSRETEVSEQWAYLYVLKNTDITEVELTLEYGFRVKGCNMRFSANTLKVNVDD